MRASDAEKAAKAETNRIKAEKAAERVSAASVLDEYGRFALPVSEVLGDLLADTGRKMVAFSVDGSAPIYLLRSKLRKVARMPKSKRATLSCTYHPEGLLAFDWLNPSGTRGGLRFHGERHDRNGELAALPVTL